jgi:hypothetical protein
MSGGRDSKSGQPRAPAMFRPDATPRQKAMAFVLLILLGAGLVLLLYGRVTGRSAASLAGFALFFVPLGIAIVHARLRAKRDPAFARQVAETQARMAPQQRARQSQLKQRAVAAAAILAMLLMLGLLRSVIPALAHMSKASFVILAQFLGAAVASALWFGWRLMKAKPSGESRPGSDQI